MGPKGILEVTFSKILLPIRLALRHIRLALRSIRLALPKKEPTASKMTPKWSPNGALVGIKKTLRRHLDKKVPTSTKPNYFTKLVNKHWSGNSLCSEI